MNLGVLCCLVRQLANYIKYMIEYKETLIYGLERSIFKFSKCNKNINSVSNI